MAKNIALSDRAYSVLARIKKREESFSDAVLRLAGEGRSPVSSFAGLWRNDEEIGRI